MARNFKKARRFLTFDKTNSLNYKENLQIIYEIYFCKSGNRIRITREHFFEERGLLQRKKCHRDENGRQPSVPTYMTDKDQDPDVFYVRLEERAKK